MHNHWSNTSMDLAAANLLAMLKKWNILKTQLSGSPIRFTVTGVAEAITSMNILVTDNIGILRNSDVSPT